MIEYTPHARQRLDEYLSEVKSSLAASPSVDADEVRRDVLEHIEAELEDQPQPVEIEKLNTVLDRLGSPQQWAPEEEIAWWRKIVLRLRHGPEDWRLAYISFGLLLVGILTGPLGWLVLIPAGALPARAVLAQTPDREKLGAQKWLIYPSLIVVYLFIAFWIIFWPVVPVIALADVGFRPYFTKVPSPQPQFLLFSFGLGASAVGTWWFILGLVFLRWPGLIRIVFTPFADNFKRKHAVMLLLVGLLLAALFAGLIVFLGIHP